MKAVNFREYRIDDIDAKLAQADRRQTKAFSPDEYHRPLDIMITGVTGAGKSTTLNSFFQESVAKIGSSVDPETMEIEAYILNDIFRIWDTPGLGDGVEIDKIHKEKMTEFLHYSYIDNRNTYGFIDIVIVIIEGVNRDMGTTYALLNEVIIPNIPKDRILVIINQCDIAMKGRYWNKTDKTPKPKLIEFLEEQSYSIKKRIKEATGLDILKPIYYSAQYEYNVKAVLDFIIDNIPVERRRTPIREKYIESFEALDNLWEEFQNFALTLNIPELLPK